MRISFIIFFILLFFANCNNPVTINQQRKELEEAVKKNGDTTLSEDARYYFENLKVEFSTPISFSTAENIAIPILLKESYVDKGVSDYSYYNIAIVDKSNQVKRFLFDNSVIIQKVKIFQEKTIRDGINSREGDYDDGYYEEETRQNEKIEKQWTEEHFENLIFFTAAVYQNRSAGNQRLYVYDLKNDILRPLSPENAHVKNWNYFKGKDEIIIYFQYDDNNDKVYNLKDDENLLLVNPFTGEINEPLFDMLQLKKLKIKVAEENE